jgi:hypothetical protein
MSEVSLEKVVSHFFTFHKDQDSQSKEEEEDNSKSKSKFSQLLLLNFKVNRSFMCQSHDLCLCMFYTLYLNWNINYYFWNIFEINLLKQ